MRLPRLVVSIVLVLSFANSAQAQSQSLPPIPTATVQDSVRSAHASSRLVQNSWFLPLANADQKDPGGDGKKFILSFYGRDSAFNPADQVQFLYGFGGEQRRGLSADLMALIFPGGWRLALGSSVASGESTGTDKQTPEQAVQRLRDGGDMYLTLGYPLLAGQKGAFTGYLFFQPRVNFLINGFAGTETLTEATESSENYGVEAYMELRDLENKGGAFVYSRWGLQHVSSAFQSTAHLDSQSFGVFEVAIGAQFGDLLRVSFQRFQAPPSAAGVTPDQLKGWHLVVQLAPTAKK